MRTVERLQKIKALDRYIESQLDKIERLESQALKVTSGPMQIDMVQGGERKAKDDLYVELITEKEELKQFVAEAIKERREFRRQIANIEDIDARSLLQMVYIDQLGIWQICDKLGISRATYYVKLRQAEKYLD
ncbi:hypothetical protein CHPC1148_0049 [Streptococcus phage CHPC1148]|uniref:Apaf-1 related killer DARK n=1 Tax=Streptococcus phage CHPC1148 TaxID=2365028 RepID=A0A3G8FB58_9CAUD|nr:hypothetical protein PP205_gp49 [Streptococcus phage CHPC1148]AZF92036.1 hypothetical protein CHPC1148_0049 [Streptococcus phage CHPC1148]